MPYGLNPAALPFTPQVGAAETQTINPEPVESFRSGVNTKGSVPTSAGRRVIEENRGNTDLDGEEDDSGRGVRPIYNTSLETLEGYLGTQVTRKDRSCTPPEKTPDNKKNPQTQAASSAITCKFWISGHCKGGDACRFNHDMYRPGPDDLKVPRMFRSPSALRNTEPRNTAVSSTGQIVRRSPDSRGIDPLTANDPWSRWTPSSSSNGPDLSSQHRGHFPVFETFEWEETDGTESLR